jgi:molybdenum cofactor biosynthesis enzyme MoaA
MRSEDVVTNFTCNQACRFCNARRPVDSAAFTATRAVVDRIKDALRRGGERIVLTGGEPTLRKDLPQLIVLAKRLGAREVWLETNAALLDDARVVALGEAGLDAVRVHMSGFETSLDRTTRDPGGFEASRRGLERLLAMELPVELVSVLSAGSLPDVRVMPGALAAFLAERRMIRCWWLVVPFDLPEPSELPRSDLLVECIAEVVRASKQLSLPVKLAPRGAPPPCVFPDPRLVAEAYSLSPGGREEPGFGPIAACPGCLLRDRCPGMNGVHRELFDPAKVRPIVDERLRRRMTLISTVQEQVARELVEPGTYRDDDGGVWDEAIVRVNFRCNQRCRFCFVSTHLPDPAPELVHEAIEHAADRGARIVISGGEPTLNPRLHDFLRAAVFRSDHPVQLQTNAVRFAEGDHAEQLVSLGVKDVFVSLHAAHARPSDVITGAEGTFTKTLAGVDRLARAGAGVTLNFVVFRSNLGELSSWVRLAASRWPGVRLNVSFVAPATDVVPLDEETVPRYSEALPAIAEAVRLAEELGVRLGGFESMCGLPLCLVPGELGSRLQPSEIPVGLDRGEFVKPPACGACVLETRCFGIRRRYVELYGSDELSPVREETCPGPFSS